MIRACLICTALMTLAGCVTSRPPDHEKTISSVAFSPDHSLLAFADAAEIRVLEVQTRKLVNILRQLPQDTKGADPANFRHGVGDTMVFLDNHRIATTGMGGLVSMWDIHSGSRLSVIESPTAEVFASTLEFSPSANRLIIGTGDGEILLTRLSGDVADPLVPVAKLAGYIWDLQFGRDGRYFASASMQAKAQAKTAGDGASDNPAAGQVNEGTSAVTPGQYSQPADGSNVAIWDAELLQWVGNLDGAREVYKMALVPGESTLLTAGEDVRAWQFLTLEQAGQVTDPSMVMQGIGVVSILAVAIPFMFLAGELPVSTVTTADLVLTPVGLLTSRPEACSRTAAISPDGQTVVSTTKGPSHNVMAVIDRASDRVVDKWTADTYVCDMEFSPNGKYLLAATNSGVLIYDTTNWEKLNIKDISAK